MEKWLKIRKFINIVCYVNRLHEKKIKIGTEKKFGKNLKSILNQNSQTGTTWNFLNTRRDILKKKPVVNTMFYGELQVTFLNFLEKKLFH